MSKPTPFHRQTSELSQSMKWRTWGGFFSVESFDVNHDSEYAAIRYSVGLMDVTPLFKYDVIGEDAASFLNYVIAKDIAKLKIGQVTYCCWADDEGKIIDDGTLTYLAEGHYRLTAAEPSIHWFLQFSSGYKVKLEDITETIGALALQGPYSRKLLVDLCCQEVHPLKFFWSMSAEIDSCPVTITRTGYTGDLGYEIWVDNNYALKVYEAILRKGKNYGLQTFGLDALDVTRIEAGFIMNGVDYFSANHCIIESRKSTPYELGLGWTVNLNKPSVFVGQKALRQEKQQGSNWKFVGLELDWLEQEKLFAKYDLPPQICSKAWRDAVPVYDDLGRQVGKATSGVWSPILKKNIALATIEADFSEVGTPLQMEYTVEFHRHKVTATVSSLPFYNPERKRLNL